MPALAARRTAGSYWRGINDALVPRGRLTDGSIRGLTENVLRPRPPGQSATAKAPIWQPSAQTGKHCLSRHLSDNFDRVVIGLTNIAAMVLYRG